MCRKNGSVTFVLHSVINDASVDAVASADVAEEGEDDDGAQGVMATYLEEAASSSRSDSNGDIVQLYLPNDFHTVVKVISGITDATREIPGTSYSSIRNAAGGNTVYKGYRWFLVPRSDPDPTAVKKIPPTVAKQRRKTGLVAMMCLDKANVQGVFKTHSDAGSHVSRTSSAIGQALSGGVPVAGHYWMHWDDVDEGLQTQYLAANELPKLAINPHGVRVQKIDPITKVVVKTYASMAEVRVKERITEKTLNTYNGEGVYKGFCWKRCD